MKTKTSHTPGPWKLETKPMQDNHGRSHFFVDGNAIDNYNQAVVVARISSDEKYEGISYDEAESNARLIAAAPTMYEFIKQIADTPCYENPGEFPEDGESGIAPCLSCQARAAIAKAEGK